MRNLIALVLGAFLWNVLLMMYNKIKYENARKDLKRDTYLYHVRYKKYEWWALLYAAIGFLLIVVKTTGGKL